MKNALPWIGFFPLTPIVLYFLLGAINHSMEEHRKGVEACEKSGGVLTRDYQCVKRVDIDPINTHQQRKEGNHE